MTIPPTNGKTPPPATEAEFEEARVLAKELEDKIWDLCADRSMGLFALAMLVGSIGGKAQAILLATCQDHRAELLAFQSTFYWESFIRTAGQIPNLLAQRRIETLLEKVLGDISTPADDSN